MTGYFEHKAEIQRRVDEFKRNHCVEVIRDANGICIGARWAKKETKP